MRSKNVWITSVVLLVGLSLFGCSQQQEHAHKDSPPPAADRQIEPTQPSAIPAHYETEPARISLAPTLDPEKFTGKTREAYRIAREAPQLIAQLPCYCYCDRGFGHKSLHSCYVDDHAAHCSVCVEEVLTAYNLQKRGLSAKQIREQIIAQYGE